ncbi:hypothetical protein BV898_10613 [Hypsibius exemplaris]|uniref:Uncharacterized protein n=1 Tax=Hypsibius exemplaris TaxID=2072580 RepID=A0A1W0WJ34_HYPEX|nr:hypothetical protein BV898_10613 [Hypsibius exemplaris]
MMRKCDSKSRPWLATEMMFRFKASAPYTSTFGKKSAEKCGLRRVEKGKLRRNRSPRLIPHRTAAAVRFAELYSRQEDRCFGNSLEYRAAYIKRQNLI